MITRVTQVITCASACRCFDASERTSASSSCALASIRWVILAPIQATMRVSSIAPVANSTISRPLPFAQCAISVRFITPVNVASQCNPGAAVGREPAARHWPAYSRRSAWCGPAGRLPEAQLPGRGSSLDRPGDRGHLVRAELDSRGLDVRLDMAGGSRAGNGQDLGRPGQQPGEHDLAGTSAMPGGRIADRLVAVGVLDRRPRQEQDLLLLAEINHRLRGPVAGVVAVLHRDRKSVV